MEDFNFEGEKDMTFVRYWNMINDVGHRNGNICNKTRVINVVRINNYYICAP